MLSQNTRSTQVQFTKEGTWSVFACDYYRGILYIALPTICDDDDDWYIVSPDLSRADAIAKRNDLKDAAYGDRLAVSL